jgi:hypothetical protein
MQPIRQLFFRFYSRGRPLNHQKAADLEDLHIAYEIFGNLLHPAILLIMGLEGQGEL